MIIHSALKSTQSSLQWVKTNLNLHYLITSLVIILNDTIDLQTREANSSWRAEQIIEDILSSLYLDIDSFLYNKKKKRKL